jgi:tRNA (guanine37-N1)-methyltransferase
VNMFAGVGCFSIIIAKHVNSTKVYSIDVNPEAFRFMTKNIKLNRVYGKVTPILGDAKNVIENQLSRSADRVLMPLPEKAFEYMPYAVSALKPKGGWIHVYTFEHAAKTANPVKKTEERVKEVLDSLGVSFEAPAGRIVRSTGPNWWQLAVDIHIS